METVALPARNAFAGALPSRIWRLVARKSSIIVQLRSCTRGIPVYCVHSIGGDLEGYDRLAAALDFDCPIYGVQATAQIMSSDIAADITKMSSLYVDEIISTQPGGPIILAGYSAGAIVALEMAQQLRRKGREIPLLIAFDGAPSNIKGLLMPWQLSYLTRLGSNIVWRLLCMRASDFTIRNVRKRLNFKRIVFGHYDWESSVTIDNGSISDVIIREGWSIGQREFMRRVYTAMVSYVPQRYDGVVILYKVKAQPLTKLLQLETAWRHICSNCEVLSLSFTRHSEFFETNAGFRKVVNHLSLALERLDVAREHSSTSTLNKNGVGV